MFHKLVLIRNHYTRYYLLKDLLIFTFAIIPDLILIKGISDFLERYKPFIYIDYLLGSTFGFLNISSFSKIIPLVIFIIFPLLMLYFSIFDNLKEISSKMN